MEMMSIPANADDPFSPYRSHNAAASPGLGNFNGNPFGNNMSQAALPLVQHAQGFRDGPSDEEDSGGYDDRKTLSKDERNTSQYIDSMSNLGTEAYAPSRNMFQNLEQKGEVDYDDKNELPAHPVAGETVEEVKESANRRRWVALCWVLTWWIPNFILRLFGRLKRPDIRQAWREKLTINLIIWFICGCTVFVIAILGNLICPREYVYSTGELASHSYNSQPTNAFVAIRGEVSSQRTCGVHFP
jgi:chitin synthase